MTTATITGLRWPDALDRLRNFKRASSTVFGSRTEPQFRAIALADFTLSAGWCSRPIFRAFSARSLERPVPTKIVLTFAKFGDGLVSGSYTIIPSLRDGSLLFYSIPLMSPSGTISRRPIIVNLALKGFSPGSSGVLELRRASTAVT
jgi:hypothetical protein